MAATATTFSTLVRGFALANGGAGGSEVRVIGAVIARAVSVIVTEGSACSSVQALIGICAQSSVLSRSNRISGLPKVTRGPNSGNTSTSPNGLSLVATTMRAEARASRAVTDILMSLFSGTAGTRSA